MDLAPTNVKPESNLAQIYKCEVDTLAEPVIFRRESPATVPLIQNHQPAVNTVE